MNDSVNLMAERAPKRVRHDVRVRTLEIARVTHLSPTMLRLTLTGDQLEGFTSLGFDDHLKLFLPDAVGNAPALPFVGPKGIQMPDDVERPVSRDYTPRRYNPARNTLDIDFAIHDNGPATNWAENAKAGDPAWIAGPRGSMIIPLAFDWHLLVGDETALPAIARRLEELPATTRVVVIAEVEDAASELVLQSEAEATVIWVHRDGKPAGLEDGFLTALDHTTFPAGDFHAWVSCESQVAKTLRSYLIKERDANPKWMRASGYWRRGSAGVHDHFDE